MDDVFLYPVPSRVHELTGVKDSEEESDWSFVGESVVTSTTGSGNCVGTSERATDGVNSESISVLFLGFSQLLSPGGETFSSVVARLIEGSIKGPAFLEAVEFISGKVVTTSPERSVWPPVPLGDVGLASAVTFKVSSSSKEPLRELMASFVAPSVLLRAPSVVAMSARVELAWVESLTKGEVVERVAGVLDSALGPVGGVPVMVTVGTAALVVADVSVGAGCVVGVEVVAVVAGAVGTEGGDGVGVLVGGGTVGNCGVNLMMVKHKRGGGMEKETEKAGGWRQN